MLAGKAIFTRVSSLEELAALPGLLGMRPHQATLVLVGGAGGMSADAIRQIRTFFEQFLVPFIESHRIAAIDGGTNTGIMEAIGVTRARLGASFPLIGVLVEALARQTPSLLQTDHTHFVLTPGSAWGDEVPWLGALAGILAGTAPALTLLVNGGEIAWQDAALSVDAKRPVLVADGSGRTADKISQGITTGSLDPRVVKLIRSGLVTVGNPFTQPEQFIKRIEAVFASSSDQ
jgi:hypothetical protein